MPTSKICRVASEHKYMTLTLMCFSVTSKGRAPLLEASLIWGLAMFS